MSYEIAGPAETRNRKWYEQLKSRFGDKLPTLSYLRQEIPLRNNQSGYVFDFKGNSGSATLTEKKLSITDAFGANQMQIALMLRQKSRPSTGLILSYPSLANIAPGFANSTAENPSTAAKQAVRDLEAVFNGDVEVRVDKNTIFDGLDTRRFRSVPSTQQGALAETNESRYGDGLVSIEPQLIMDGARSNSVSVNVPTFNGMSIEPDNSDFELVLVCILSGFKIQGGAELKNK